MKRAWSFVFMVFMLWISCGKKVTSTAPEVSDITEAVYASARIKARGQYYIYSTVNGILTQNLVNPGSVVTKNQVLFMLDNTGPKYNAENAKAAYELVSENSRKGSDKIQELELALSIAREKYILDSVVYIKQQKLWSEGIGSEIDLDQKKLTFQSSRTGWLSAKSRLAQLRSQLSSELKRAELSYNASRKIEEDYIIRSISDGMIYDVLKEKGELITPQTPLAIAGEAGAFYLELEVDENDIVKVQKNMLVAVTMDSYKGKVFQAIVTRIDPIMNERTRTFKVEAIFEEKPPQLYPNLTAECNIIIQVKKNALTIPAAYLVDGKYVYTSPDQKTEVKTGLRDYRKVEIISGISKDSKLYMPAQ